MAEDFLLGGWVRRQKEKGSVKENGGGGGVGIGGVGRDALDTTGGAAQRLMPAGRS